MTGPESMSGRPQSDRDVVHAEDVPLDGGGYTMDHTAIVYLLDRNLRFAGTIDFHEDRQIALPKLRRLLGLASAE